MKPESHAGTNRALGLIISVATFGVLSAQTPSAPGPQPPSSSQPRQIFRTEANLVRVDVHVLVEGRSVPDLQAADFELLEDGVRQKIDQFEYVRVEAPQSATVTNPSSTAASFELAADPRNRVFVLFLDRYHVLEFNSLQTPMPLVRLIDSLIGPSDLIGLMTPEMDFRDLILGRNTDVLRGGLLESRRWGTKLRDCNDTANLDETEKMYTLCFPPVGPCSISPTAMAVISRRRESFTFGVLRELVQSIGARREARTHVVLVSEGWPLARPHDGLTELGAASPPKIQIQPGGRLGTQNPGDFNVDQDLCARHLRAAAQLDNQRTYRDLIDDANRNNASFYVVDPGGLRVELPRSPVIRPGDLGMRHVETLESLAENTDGRAIVHTNDIAGALQRVVDDLSGYYLLGYYSTNAKSDGTYRSINVNVNRPGFEIRARKGYRAWTADDVKMMEAARAAANAPADPASLAHGDALGRLARLKPNTVLFLHATVDPGASSLLVVGELSATAARSADWRQGGDAQILVSTADGSPAGSGRATIAPGGRAFLARVPLERASGPLEYEIGVRMKAAGGSASLLESIRAARTTDPIGEPLAFRSAGPQQPVATFLWYRTEQARFEAPLAAGVAPPTGRLLDQAGNPMPVPVAVAVREDGTSRWAVATLPLAPLSPADYVLELSSGTARRLIALRVER